MMGAALVVKAADAVAAAASAVAGCYDTHLLSQSCLLCGGAMSSCSAGGAHGPTADGKALQGHCLLLDFGVYDFHAPGCRLRVLCT